MSYHEKQKKLYADLKEIQCWYVVVRIFISTIDWTFSFSFSESLHGSIYLFKFLFLSISTHSPSVVIWHQLDHMHNCVGLTLFLVWKHFPCLFQQLGSPSNSWRGEESQTEVDVRLSLHPIRSTAAIKKGTKASNEWCVFPNRQVCSRNIMEM